LHIVLSRWAITIRVQHNVSRFSWTRRSVMASNSLVASSSRRIAGRRRSALAIATRVRGKLPRIKPEEFGAALLQFPLDMVGVGSDASLRIRIIAVASVQTGKTKPGPLLEALAQAAGGEAVLNGQSTRR
jgi:hypothetical protein